MKGLNLNQRCASTCIPISDQNDLGRYHDSIVAILNQIKIDEMDQDLRENLINVYEFLAYLNRVRSSESYEDNRTINPVI